MYVNTIQTKEIRYAVLLPSFSLFLAISTVVFPVPCGAAHQKGSNGVASQSELKVQLNERQVTFLSRFTGKTLEKNERTVIIGRLPPDSFSDGKRLNAWTLRLTDRPRSFLSDRLWEKLLSGPNDPEVESVIVHEMIHYLYGKRSVRDEVWVEEGMALLGEFLYTRDHFGKRFAFDSFRSIVIAALTSPSGSLVRYERSLADQGRSFLFFLYLHETLFGFDFTESHYRQASIGIAGIENALRLNRSRNFVPKTWKNSETILSGFFVSLVMDRNFLEVGWNDWFTQWLQERGGRSLSFLSWSGPTGVSEVRIPPKGYLRLTLGSRNCDFQRPHDLYVYRLKSSPNETDAFYPTREFLDRDERLNARTKLLILNLGDIPIQFKPDCD